MFLDLKRYTLGGPICQNISISPGKHMIYEMAPYALRCPICQNVNISNGKPSILDLKKCTLGCQAGEGQMGPSLLRPEKSILYEKSYHGR